MSTPVKLVPAACLLLAATGAAAATLFQAPAPSPAPLEAPHARLDDTGNFAPPPAR